MKKILLLCLITGLSLVHAMENPNISSSGSISTPSFHGPENTPSTSSSFPSLVPPPALVEDNDNQDIQDPESQLTCFLPHLEKALFSHDGSLSKALNHIQNSQISEELKTTLCKVLTNALTKKLIIPVLVLVPGSEKPEIVVLTKALIEKSSLLSTKIDDFDANYEEPFSLACNVHLLKTLHNLCNFIQNNKLSFTDTKDKKTIKKKIISLLNNSENIFDLYELYQTANYLEALEIVSLIEEIIVKRAKPTASFIDETQKPLTLNHEAVVRDIACSSDGNLIASVGESHIKIWDIRTGKCIKSLNHGGASFLKFSPNNRLLASCCKLNNTIKIWAIDSGLCLREFKEAENMAFSPDNKHVAILFATYPTNDLKIFDINVDSCIKDLPKLELNAITALQYNEIGNSLIAFNIGSYNEHASLLIIDVKTGDCKVIDLSKWLDITTWLLSLGKIALNSDGTFLASGTNDSLYIPVGDVNSPENIIELIEPSRGITALALSSDSKFLAYNSKVNTLKTWNLDSLTSLTGKFAQTCTQTIDHNIPYVNSIIWSTNGNFIALGSQHGTITIYPLVLAERTKQSIFLLIDYAYHASQEGVEIDLSSCKELKEIYLLCDKKFRAFIDQFIIFNNTIVEEKRD